MERRPPAADDGSDIIEYITSKGKRIEKSLSVPTPEGRSQAGWTAVQGLKVQPEVQIQLEQLREHPVFKGHWKTSAQVAWSMILLGLYNMNEFLNDPGTEGWEKFKTAHQVTQIANNMAAEQRREKALQEATQTFRCTAMDYIRRGDAFGKYRAWKCIEDAMAARDAVENKAEFDTLMRTGVPSLATALMVDNDVARIWEKLFPVVGGSLHEGNEDALFTLYTEPYYEELNAIRAQEEHDDEG